MNFSKTQNLKPKTCRASRGFTLVEMIVSVALFAIVMTVAVGALLSLTAANKKAQALQSVMNNLNITVDGMVRNIRMGGDFDGSTGCASNSGGIDDCTGGATSFTFTCNPASPSCGSPGTSWTYSFCDASKICKNGEPLTADEVEISDLQFFVVGTTPGDTTQPKVVIVVSGTAGGASAKTKTDFHVQATAVQRELDL